MLVEAERPLAALAAVRAGESRHAIAVILHVLDDAALGGEAFGAAGTLKVLGHVAAVSGYGVGRQLDYLSEETLVGGCGRATVLRWIRHVRLPGCKKRERKVPSVLAGEVEGKTERHGGR